MPAAETPSAGHETAPNWGWPGGAGLAAGVDVPEGGAADQGRAVGPEGDLGSFAATRPARPPAAARQTSTIRSGWLVLRRR
jgi:hypothetical protein